MFHQSDLLAMHRRIKQLERENTVNKITIEELQAENQRLHRVIDGVKTYPGLTDTKIRLGLL